MCAAKLKEALNDCLINFDKRVLLTDLINEYQMPIADVSQILDEYCKRHEEQDGVKYEKRYVVYGMEEPSKEVFKIVKGETKLNEWLEKLNNAESALYSVEVEGGSKSSPEDFKPVRWCAVKLENVEMRTGGRKQMVNGNAAEVATIKEEPKSQTKPANGIAGAFAKTKTSDAPKNEAKDSEKPSSSSHTKISPTEKLKSSVKDEEKKKDVAQVPPQKSGESKKISPKDKKAAATAGQKGIGNFFAPKAKAAGEASKKSDKNVESEKTKTVNDFFKKQAEKPTVARKDELKQEEKKANTSVQLFDDEEDEDEEEQEQPKKKQVKKEKETPMEVAEESSDEEEHLNKLRRKVAEVDEREATTSRKRLRIEDSDDEENEAKSADDDEQQPQEKQSKLDEKAVVELEDSPPKSETYLDEDGFVITIKSKKSYNKKPAATAKKSAVSEKSPKRTSPKTEKPKQTTASAAKTKQGNIMSFFKKK